MIRLPTNRILQLEKILKNNIQARITEKDIYISVRLQIDVKVLALLSIGIIFGLFGVVEIFIDFVRH
ncbi:hypothetical protein SAMN02745753_03430 [Marinomonas polaris DSM 16579]|uniref:Uncharacterized protein n=1 Tax=Marinomonas polaris DSM 16579 TaxID=1122206 RepID=A0A1M5HSK0_9GAMM|nr:hypothetical protein SAMN02745753_03430 [Marinomonas polaris DSM 16579]